MSKKEPKKGSLLFVILLAGFISITVVISLFFIQFLSTGLTASFSTAEQSYSEGDPEAAIAELDQLNPQERGTSTSMLWYGKSWYLKAYKEYNDEEWRQYGIDSTDWFKGESVDQSIHYLKRAMEDPETEAEAVFYLALIYMHKGWFSQAESKFVHLFSLDQTHREGILNFAVLKSRQLKYEESKEILLQGVELYPDFAEYYKNLYWLYRDELSDNEKAVHYGDMFLKLAQQGDVNIIRVRSDMRDLLSRFPELANDTLELLQDEDRVFIPRPRN